MTSCARTCFRAGFGERDALYEARAENERLRAALKPFADAGSFKSAIYGDLSGALSNITLADLRNAAAALNQQSASEK